MINFLARQVKLKKNPLHFRPCALYGDLWKVVKSTGFIWQRKKKRASVTGRIDVHRKYIEDNTRWREDRNFIFEW